MSEKIEPLSRRPVDHEENCAFLGGDDNCTCGALARAVERDGGLIRTSTMSAAEVKRRFGVDVK